MYDFGADFRFNKGNFEAPPRGRFKFSSDIINTAQKTKVNECSGSMKNGASQGPQKEFFIKKFRKLSLSFFFQFLFSSKIGHTIQCMGKFVSTFFFDNLGCMTQEPSSELVKEILKCRRFQFVNTAQITEINERSAGLKSGTSRGL